jgi:hypothetical protein
LNEVPAFHVISEWALFHRALKQQGGRRGSFLHNESVTSRVLFRVLILGSLAGGCALAGQGGAKLPDGPGKATMQKICSGCHAPEIVLGRHETRDGWEQIVSDMANKGANGTDDEFDQIINYLATNFPKKSDGNNGQH